MYIYRELPNGVRIAVYQLNDVKSVNMSAMLTAGPVIEDDLTHGGSHFIEHIVLGGTTSYPTKRAFANALEELGVSYGGYTSTQEMGFEFDIPYTNLYPTLNILKEIITSPVFSEDIIEKERSVILEEMQDRENSPDFQFYYHTQSLRYKDPNHPLQKKVIGTKQSIESLTKDQLYALYKRIFIPSNLHICIVGNVNMERVNEQVDELFGSTQSSETFIRPSFSFDDLSRYTTKAITDDKFTNVYTDISTKGYERIIPLSTQLSIRLLSAMLTGLRTSRLFQDVREKEGLVYNVSSDWHSAWGVGSFSISFESDASKLHRIMEIIYGDIREIKKNAFSKDELEHTKNYFKNRILLSFSSPTQINQWVMDLLYEHDESIFPEDLIAATEAITIDDIMHVVADIFDKNFVNILMMGKLDTFILENSLAKIGDF